MSIEIDSQAPYDIDEAISEIYEAAATVRWPQFFDGWIVVLLNAGFEQEEVYSAIDEAKACVKKKAMAKQALEESDILSLARLIAKHHQSHRKSSGKILH